MRVVLDTSIYIASVLREGISEEIIEVLVSNTNFVVITSDPILTELAEKLKDKFNWSSFDVDEFLGRLNAFARVVKVEENLLVVTRDPKDNKILECAVSGNADLIITLDQDLIKLKNFRGIAIIHPKTFVWTFPEYFKGNAGD